MSAMKGLLGDVDFEMLQNVLANDSLDLVEMVELYNNAGGEETYDMWCMVYGYELAENWLNNYDGDTTDNTDLATRGVAYIFVQYNKWLKDIFKLGGL